MVILTTTLTKMLELFSFILIGYILRKRKYLQENAGVILSRLENSIFMPALIINTFVSRCTIENLVNKSNFILWETVIIIVTVFVAWPVAKLLSSDTQTEKVLRYALVIPNFAFMGNAVVESVLGNDMLYNYMILTIPLNIFAYTVGIMWLMPAKDGIDIKKCILNPIFLSLVIGMIGGISGVKIPNFIMNTIQNAGNCMAPVAMLLTGFIIGGYEIKALLTDLNVYVVTILRLVIIPILVSGILYLLGVDSQLKVLATCILAMPFGLNTIIIPAAYEGDTKKGAAMTMISHALAVITIPIILTVVLN